MKEGKVLLGANVFSSLFALSEEEQERGLMFVKPPVPVMSFVYSRPKISKFWMMNTPAPLDIVFSCNGKITQIHKGLPFSTAMIGDDSRSDLVIELPSGSVKLFGLEIGQNAAIFKI